MDGWSAETQTKAERNNIPICGKLDNTESKAEKWVELEEKTFNFATYAGIRFLDGGLELKKEILTGLGEKRTIRNKRLDIEPYEWFELIGNSYPGLEAEYLGLEPAKMGDFENKTEALASIRTRWQGRRESNPNQRFWRPLFYH